MDMSVYESRDGGWRTSLRAHNWLLLHSLGTADLAALARSIDGLIAPLVLYKTGENIF